MSDLAAFQHQEGALCECAYCRDKKDFELPGHLLEALKNKNVVIFAGAGISTENKTYAQHTLYDSISSQLKAFDLSFPRLMSNFCEQPDGRSKLVRQIRDRFNYQRSFDDIYNGTTRFHRAIRAIYTIDTVVTTNWDTLFEDEAGFEAFVYDSDLAFWQSARKKVLKIHGSITNSGSLIATEEDYAKSYKRLSSGPLGAQLKSIISTSTIVYVGYSLRDENYLKLLKIIAKMMGDHVKHSYFVSPKANATDLSRLPIRMTPIATDGAYFIENIRSNLEDTFQIMKDSAFDAVELALEYAIQLHLATSDRYGDKPTAALVLALSYQNGLIHAYQRIIKMNKSGEYYSCEKVHALVHGYVQKESEYSSRDDVWNAAYCSGYKNGILFLLMSNDRDDVPFPPEFELDHPKFENFNSISKLKRFAAKNMPPDFLDYFKRLVEGMKSSGKILFPNHTPFV